MGGLRVARDVSTERKGGTLREQTLFIWTNTLHRCSVDIYIGCCNQKNPCDWQLYWTESETESVQIVFQTQASKIIQDSLGSLLTSLNSIQ